MLNLRTTSPFELFDRLDEQLSQQRQEAGRVPAAEVHDTAEAYTISLELPGVDRNAIDVKATERTLQISAERRSTLDSEAQDAPSPELGSQPEATAQTQRQPLISEFRYGTWSRSFRFATPIDPQRISAVYRDGVLTVTAPKAPQHTSVSVKVEG
ncbi:Hsp20/alpha crystallin family protein [Cyanobium sp. LEGE 06113]|uniref:Hsp20/alpha crystallin family protein n=1 Tax=Cyanobium sp. LEGE 06113 TaxID=1297573 RepID=UPI001882EDE0|nr:Hsp20/alpha crystallin family protein [Cyanobium sp. LEGE 06113]MBE9153790.1 Hsp20/alpha crystallin family protein [Cyanobium sp. LEGE 06113]